MQHSRDYSNNYPSIMLNFRKNINYCMIITVTDILIYIYVYKYGSNIFD